MAAVAYNGRPKTPDVVVDETWFSDPDLCKQGQVCRAITLHVFLKTNMVIITWSTLMVYCNIILKTFMFF
jgi:hypothetical protein